MLGWDFFDVKAAELESALVSHNRAIDDELFSISHRGSFHSLRLRLSYDAFKPPEDFKHVLYLSNYWGHLRSGIE